MCVVTFIYFINNTLTMNDSFIPDTSAMFSDNVILPLTCHDSVVIPRDHVHAYIIVVITITLVFIVNFNLNKLEYHDNPLQREI